MVDLEKALTPRTRLEVGSTGMPMVSMQNDPQMILAKAHASPRLHWRRGHIREYASGTKAWVRPHLVGTEAGGVIVHDYEL